MKLLRRLAWAPICLIFGHVYVKDVRRPILVDAVICKDCGKQRCGAETIRDARGRA